MACQWLLVCRRADFLAECADGSPCGHRHQAGVVGDGAELEAHAEGFGGVAGRAVVDAGELLALLAGGDQLCPNHK